MHSEGITSLVLLTHAFPCLSSLSCFTEEAIDMVLIMKGKRRSGRTFDDAKQEK